MDPIKITIHTLLSVSIFLIFYSHITLNMLTTLSIGHVIGCFTNRQAMFILLNFILLLLTGESGLLFGSLDWAEDHHHTESHERSDQREVPPVEPKSIDEREMVVHGEEVEASVGSLDLVLVEVEEEEEEGECLSVEELNKKFEEFIEKVKRQMRMEAMQLDMVH